MTYVDFVSILAERAHERLAEALWLHGLASLDTGQGAAAVDDVRLILRLRTLWKWSAYPANYDQLALSLVWHGLALRQWTPAQRAVLRLELGRDDRLADALEAILRWRLSAIERMTPDSLNSGYPYAPFQFLVPLGTGTPGGLADIKVEIALTSLTVRAAVDVPHHRIDLAPLRAAFAPTVEKELLPWTGFARFQQSAATARIALRAARAQATCDLALVALTLEDYRDEIGDYPARLAVLEVAGIPCSA